MCLSFSRNDDEIIIRISNSIILQDPTEKHFCDVGILGKYEDNNNNNNNNNYDYYSFVKTST